jgi:hypothetical protein
MLRLVAEEKLAILQADPGDPKTMAGVFPAPRGNER